ncbi:MAG: PAS domain S-box protein [Actinomycetota bacterium]
MDRNGYYVVKAIVIALAIGFGFFIADSIINAYILHRGSFSRLLFRPDLREIWVRSFVLFLALIFNLAYGQLKRVEDELRISEERFRRIFEEGPLGITLVDFDYRFVKVNPRFAQMLGYTEEELTKLKFTDITHPDDVSKDTDLAKSLFAGKIPFYQTEKRYIKKNGEILLAGLTASMIHNEKGKPLYGLGMIEDITERKKAEESLRLFMQAVEEAPNGVQITDLEGRIIYSNKAVEEIYGFSPGELKGKHVNEMNADPKYASKVILPSVLKTGRWAGELMVKHKKGYIFPIYLNTSMVRDAGGRPIALMGIITDITARKQAEKLNNALSSINMAIISTLDFNEIMQKVIVESARALEAEVIGITLRENDRWVIRYVYGPTRYPVGVELPPEEVDYIKMVVETRGPVAVSDAFHDPRVNNELMRELGVRSTLAIPLIAREKVFGVMRFTYRTAQVTFTDAQIDFAAKLGTSVSLALENARLFESQRRIADTLQEALLTVPEKVEGVEFGSLYHSATEAARVGGDFYDIFELEHGKVGIVVGDISGSGIEAAALTSVVRNTIRAYAYEDGTPALIMSKTNDTVSRISSPNDFVTVFLGILNIGDGSLSYCSAGHPPVMIGRLTGVVDLLTERSPVIGAFKGLRYRSGKDKLSKGDMMVAYTDGVTEARHDKDFFGEDRLIELVRNLRAMPAREIPKVIFGEVVKYSAGRLLDDIVILAVSLKG